MGSIDRQDSTPQLLNRLRMRQIALILALQEKGTLGGAAAQLGMTQPAATKMLRELEHALGQPLFERAGRGLVPNAAAERVTGYFRGIRGSVEALNRELSDFRLGGAGKLSVGSVMAASPGALTNALLALKAELPMLSIEIAVDTSDRLLAQLREGVLELFVGRLTPLAGIDCTFTPLAGEPLAVIARTGHPLAHQRRLDFGALLDYPWILQPLGSPMREVIEREFREHHAALPRALIETSSILTTINLVRGSDMLAIVPEAVARRDAEHGIVSVLPYQLRHALQSYGTLVPKERPLSQPAERFLALLHESHRPDRRPRAPAGGASPTTMTKTIGH
jgi:DNA-binding transcriptional LysR family regulator